MSEQVSDFRFGHRKWPFWEWEKATFTAFPHSRKGPSGAQNENLRPVLTLGLWRGYVVRNSLTFGHWKVVFSLFLILHRAFSHFMYLQYKSSTRPSTIEIRLSFGSFTYAQVRSAKHDRANLCHHRSGHQGYSKGERHLEEWTLLVQRLCPIFGRHLRLLRVPGFLSVNVCSSNLDFCPLPTPRGPLKADLLR